MTAKKTTAMIRGVHYLDEEEYRGWIAEVVIGTAEEAQAFGSLIGEELNFTLPGTVEVQRPAVVVSLPKAKKARKKKKKTKADPLKEPPAEEGGADE